MWAKPGAKYGCKGFTEGNNCLFMSVYLSYDKDVRKILAGGDTDNPPEAFRKFHADHNPGANGKGCGYNNMHFVLWLEHLRDTKKIKNFACVAVRKNVYQSPIDFLTMKMRNRHVGTRYILFGNAPKANKADKAIAEINRCVHPMVESTVKGVDYLKVTKENKRIFHDKGSNFVLKQENAMYNLQTSRDSWHKGLTQSAHGCCVAYYPASKTTSKEWWRQNGLVPCIFDNGKQVASECTAKNLVKVIYNINHVISVSIELY